MEFGIVINVDERQIKLANDNGFDVRIWGVGTIESMKKVYQYNIEGMYSTIFEY